LLVIRIRKSDEQLSSFSSLHVTVMSIAVWMLLSWCLICRVSNCCSSL